MEFMTRYQTPIGAEVEMQPGSHGRVLRNRLGITRKTEMDRTEYLALVAVQQRYLLRISASTRFDIALICRMHRDWLCDIYEWAGEYRTVEVSKGNMTWPPAMRVPQNMERFSREVLGRYTPRQATSLREICHALAVVHAEFLLIHPFRVGNGRMARWLADLMAAQAGLPLPVYRFAGHGSQAVRARYLEAVRHGYLQRYKPLEDFFTEALRLAE
jgi:cell filamentation protein